MIMIGLTLYSIKIWHTPINHDPMGACSLSKEWSKYCKGSVKEDVFCLRHTMYALAV